ncbi:hypothetical protein EDC04DRAFT_2606939 [Pisolithus marmoratus]|nr:hypothetical protein EDC04DRAFT_2606939 [Pisolithus marmoratus]
MPPSSCLLFRGFLLIWTGEQPFVLSKHSLMECQHHPYGHATAQTMDIVGHMASCFIPTVEHEWIDFVNRNVTTWNRELLYIRGFLCRVVYELELSDIQRLWKEAATDMPQSPKLHDQYFLHLPKFFMVYHSMPSVEVTECQGELQSELTYGWPVGHDYSLQYKWNNVLGLYIPLNGPLPLSLIPLGVSQHFSHEELSGFGWKEFTVASWL